MKLKKITTVFSLVMIVATLTACHFTTEHTYKDIRYEITNDYILQRNEESDILRTENADIEIMQSESELGKLIRNSAYIEEYDVTYQTDNLKINDIYFSKIVMEYSDKAHFDSRFTSIEYCFSIKGNVYRISAEHIPDTTDIKLVEDEIHELLENLDISW